MSGKVVDDLADVIRNKNFICIINNLQSSAVVILQAIKEISNLKKLDLIACQAKWWMI